MSKFITNSFQVPNAFVDEAMFELSGNAVKCYLFIMRKTLGWQKEWDYIPTTQFHLITGIKKPHTVYDAIKELEMCGLLRVVKERGKVSGYAINLELSEVNIPVPEMGSAENGHTVVPKIGSAFEETSAENGHTSKDSIKYNNKNTILSSSIEDNSPVIKPVRKKKTAPVNEIINAYNEVLGDVLPKAIKPSAKRTKMITDRWYDMLNSQHPGKDILRYTDTESGIAWWKAFFSKVKLRPHWLGDNESGWAANLDWIIKEDNFIKVLEFRPVSKK